MKTMAMTPNQRPTDRGQSGQAVVEFSVLMLVFVPCLLYGFFLSDAGYAQLEVQETVVSSVWDFSQRNAQTGDPSCPAGTCLQSSATAVQSGNRAEYIDHTSSFDDPNNISTPDKAAFNQMALKTDWVGTSGTAYTDPPSSGATAVTCSAQSGTPDLNWTNILSSSDMPAAIQSVLSQANPLLNFGSDTDLNGGGSVNCWARAVAYNYLIPQTFLQGFSHVNLANETDHQQSDDPTSIKGAGTNVFLRDQAQIAYGTWALDDGETTLGSSGDADIQFGKSSSHPFQVRVSKILAGELAPGISFALVQAQALAYANTTASSVMEASEYMAYSALAQNIPGVSLGTGDQMLSMPGFSIDPGIDPLMTFLVARYNTSDSNAHHPTNHCAWPSSNAFYYIDIFTCLIAGDNEYESTPTQSAYANGTSNFYKEFQARGPEYMGTQGDVGWAP